MSAHPESFVNEDEYLRRELEAEYKSEYFNGEIFAMGGASESHVLITLNVAATLRAALRGKPRRVYAADLRVRVSPTGLYTYPDVVVVCGERKFYEKQKDTLHNPTAIFEVLSESTQDYDRGQKFEHYRRLDTLQEYITIAQDRVHVEHYARQNDNRWLLTEMNELDVVLRLLSLDCEIALADVYENIELPSTEPAES
ncbi:MAG: Uma2 family endonuclease [Pyrinomonadaceae bacterium]